MRSLKVNKGSFYYNTHFFIIIKKIFCHFVLFIFYLLLLLLLILLFLLLLLLYIFLCVTFDNEHYSYKMVRTFMGFSSLCWKRRFLNVFIVLLLTMSLVKAFLMVVILIG